MSSLDNSQKNELIPISSIPKPESVYKKIAERVLLESQISFQKARLMEQIDFSLKENNKQLFMKLSNQYNTLINEYSNLNS